MAEKSTVERHIDQLYELLASELPPPTHTVGSCLDAFVPCRDHVRLMTRVVLPGGAGPWPVIASRNPYTPVDSDDHMQIGVLALVKYGYAVVYQQVRGLYHSEGDWYAFENERNDGLDLLDWIIAQPWCNGRIGLYGGSYLGHVIWAMADVLPPQVKTMYTLVWGDDPYGSFYENGMFKQATWTLWAAQMMHPEDRSDLSQPDLEGFQRALNVSPQLEADQKICGHSCPWYRDWITYNCRSDPYWNRGIWKNYTGIASRISIPVLLQTGWFDIFLESTLKAFSHLSPEIRAKSRLIVGPWHHGNAVSGPLKYPDENRFGSFQIKLALEWFDLILKNAGHSDGCGCVDAYVMGEGVWRRWDGQIGSEKSHRLYLRRGEENVHRLAPAAGAAEELISYLYDPQDPVPTRGGKLLMNYHEGVPEPECATFQPLPGARSDVCSFLTKPLEAPVTVVGAAVVHLAVCSDAKDTAFTAKLMEVRENGDAIGICDGISTLTFRAGDHERLSYTPGQQVELEFRLPATAWKFSAGARIRLDISSSNYPAFHRHPNTAAPWAQEICPVAAVQTLVLGKNSWIDFPIG